MSETKKKVATEGNNQLNQLNCTTTNEEGQNILYVTVPTIKNISRDRYGGAVIRVDAETADILEGFAQQTRLPVTKIASSFIKFAAKHTIIKELYG